MSRFKEGDWAYVVDCGKILPIIIVGYPGDSRPKITDEPPYYMYDTLYKPSLPVRPEHIHNDIQSAFKDAENYLKQMKKEYLT